MRRLGKQVLHIDERITASNRRGRMTLVVDGVEQSALYADPARRGELTDEYQKLMTAGLLWALPRESPMLCVLGHGGGALTAFLRTHYEFVDSVERDEVVARIAREHFGTGPVIESDAQWFLRQRNRDDKYGTTFVDIFNGQQNAINYEIAELALRNTQGAVVFNTWQGNRAAQHTLDTLAKVEHIDPVVLRSRETENDIWIFPQHAFPVEPRILARKFGFRLDLLMQRTLTRGEL
jgi:spermidine synthase